MKKILFVIYSYSMGGGAERVLTDIVNHMDQSKYDISILPYAQYDVFEEQVNSNIKILPSIVDMNKEKKYKKYLKYILVHLFPEILRKKYIKNKYDVEISFNYQIPSFLVKETKKTKVIEWNHGDVYDLQKRPFKRYLQRRSYKRATRIVAISENTTQSILNLFPQFQSKLAVIYNGVNIKRIQALSEEKCDIILKDPAILFIGRIEEAKNPLQILEVIRNLKSNNKKINLYYVGTGSQDELLKKRIKEYELEDRVFCLGYQKNPYPIIKQCRAICMMSKTEGFPTVFTEGMVLGKPFISSEVGGTNELSANGKCGMVVHDSKECEKALGEVVLNLQNNEKMSENSKVHIERFSLEQQISKIEGLIESL